MTETVISESLRASYLQPVFVYIKDDVVLSDTIGNDLLFDLINPLVIGTPPFVDVSLRDVTEAGASIYIDATPFAGWQFDLSTVTNGNFVITDVSGGFAGDAGHSINFEGNGVVGYSGNLTEISGEGILVNVTKGSIL